MVLIIVNVLLEELSHPFYAGLVIEKGTAGIVDVLMFPLLVLSRLVLKNYMDEGGTGTSTLGDHAMILFVLQINNETGPRSEIWRYAPALQIGISGAMTGPANWGEEGPFPAFMVTAGVCFPLTPSGHDLTPVAEMLETRGQPLMAERIWQDVENAPSRKYLISGVDRNGAHSWFAVYGRISAEIARYEFLEDPWAWITQIEYIYSNHFPNPKYDHLLTKNHKNTVSRWFRSATYRGFQNTYSFFAFRPI